MLLLGFSEFSDIGMTNLLTEKTYEYFTNGEVFSINKDGKRAATFRYDRDRPILNPLNLVDHDLSCFINSERKTSYNFVSNMCFGYEVEVLPVKIEQGYYYETNTLNLPSFMFSSRGISFIYNDGCPID